jgi:hypothetical protein
MPDSSETITKYLDAVGASFELLAQAGTSALERGAAVSKEFAAQTRTSQREAIEFAKKLAEDPDHVLSTSYLTLSESAATARARALSLAQLMCQSALDSGAESRALGEKLVEANKASSEAASELSRMWATMNPVAKFIVQAAESGIAATAVPAAKAPPARAKQAVAKKPATKKAAVAPPRTAPAPKSRVARKPGPKSATPLPRNTA